MPVSAAIRLNPQSAVRNMQHRLRRSELELRRPRTDLSVGPRSSRGVRSAPLPVQIPNPPTKVGVEG
eukprot:801407-Alexandrium_andersonii.AAC.1